MDIGARFIVALVFSVVNALILREIVVLIFKLKDETVSTALFVAVCVSIVLFIASFFDVSTISSIILFVIISLLFMFLTKLQYETDWKKSFLIWLVWFLIFFAIGIVVVLISVLV